MAWWSSTTATSRRSSCCRLPWSAVVRVDATVPVREVGYIRGAGDELPGMLRQLGIEVTVLGRGCPGGRRPLATSRPSSPASAPTTPAADLVAAQARLLDYVAGGGTLVVQYSTDRGLVTDQLGPYPFKISHDRVTDETAAVRFLLPDNVVLLHRTG